MIVQRHFCGSDDNGILEEECSIFKQKVIVCEPRVCSHCLGIMT